MEVETAKAGHRPKTRQNTGFSLNNPFASSQKLPFSILFYW
jgi:hypothetical protein